MKIGEYLNHAVRYYPDRLAVACGSKELTFKQIGDQSDRIGNALLKRGMNLGDRVVVFLPNDATVATAFAALLKTGALIVPVSTRLTAPELAFQVEDSAPFALFYASADAETVSKAVANHPEVLLIDIDGKAEAGGVTMDKLIEEGDATRLPPLPPEHEDAMIAYTSGTTGNPKGAILTHNLTIFSHLNSSVNYGQTANDIYMATSPMAHRTGFAKIVSGFLFGSTTIAQPKFDPEEIIHLIDKYKVTNISAVSTAAGMIMDYLETTDKTCDSLHTMVSGGEAFALHIKERMRERLPNLGLYLFYGATESGTIAYLTPEDQFTKHGSVGRQAAGMEVRLVDDAHNDVAPGEVGEIVNRASVPGRFATFRGYYNNPEANEKSLENGWFYTGDAGRFDEDGYLFLMDRVKDMILSGGLNIFSREVELAVASAKGVRDVAVCAAPDKKWGEAVTAYVVPEPGASPNPDDIIEHCKTQIASYKKPKHVFIVDKLPTNAVGKVLKRELREDAKARLGMS